MDKYYVVSFSGGKDSTAMLLHLMELNEPIDEVIFCDTYKEFEGMYKHIELIKEKVELKGIKFTIIRSDISFDDYLFNYTCKHKNPEEFKKKHGDVQGMSWPSAHVRWCSARLKINVISRYLKELNKTYEVFQYIGLAADEQKRLEREHNKNPHHLHPLVDWGWTEEDCLEYCYSLGYNWDGLYQHFKRVSCWCCPLQSLEELRQLRKFYPSLWQELIEMDNKTWRNFRSDYSIPELDIRFAFEEQRLAEGKSIRNREFFNEFRKLIQEGNGSNAAN